MVYTPIPAGSSSGLSLVGTVLTVGTPATALAIPNSNSLADVALQVAGDPDTGIGPIGGANTISDVAGGIEVLRKASSATRATVTVGGSGARGSATLDFKTSAGPAWAIDIGTFANGDNVWSLTFNGAVRLCVSTTGNIAIGQAAAANLAVVLATNAAAGHMLIPTCAGTPTGAAPDGAFLLDTTGIKLWARVGAAWKGIVIA